MREHAIRVTLLLCSMMAFAGCVLLIAFDGGLFKAAIAFGSGVIIKWLEEEV